MLTFYEVATISHRLLDISDTWADLWICLYYLPVGVGRLRMLRYSDITGEVITLKKMGRYKEMEMLMPPIIIEIIQRRRKKYPADDYVFQSHSNRVKAVKKPVTVVAFNQALKSAASGITTKSVSSKSA